MGCPIRKSSDQRVFAPPRRLSQRITSFIACACQGIHQLPLRHLIILIANAHPDRCPNSIGRKDQLLEICSMAAVRQANHMQAIERRLRRTDIISARPITKGYGPSKAELRHRNPNKSSLHDFIQNRQGTEVRCKLFSLRMTASSRSMVEPDGIEPTTPCLQSRCSPS